MANALNRQAYVSSLILIIFFLDGIYAEEVCGNADLKTVLQTGLSESTYWQSKTQDIVQCAKLCIRQKMCNSITYDTLSRQCELNSGTMSNTPTRRGASLVYSEFTWWPSSLDKNCYSRPCDVSESCIPGTLLAGSSECSYNCLQFKRDVCPLPPWGVTNGRTVGSQNTYTCEKGTVGGGTATCLPSKQWDKDITPTCTDIHEHPCDDSYNPCPLIKGRCSTDGRCECGPNKSYNTSIKECFLDCGAPPDVSNAQLLGNENTRTYQCDPDHFPTASSNATLTCTEAGWVPANNFSCFTCGEPNEVFGASVTGSGQVRQYVCNTNDAPHLYPVPGTGDGTITCDENALTWTPGGFKCGGLRLKPNHPKMQDIPHCGYLEFFHNNEWRAVTHEDWDWRATKVACNSLGFKFGGTFHKDWFDDENQQRLTKAYKLDNIACTGNEASLELCPNINPKDGNMDKEIALTCFDYDITVPGNVELDSGPDRGGILVHIATGSGLTTTYGNVCGEGWSDRETKVVCRTMDPIWQRYGECKDNCGVTPKQPYQTNYIDCDGDEPHLFYCENRGWGYTTDCDASKLVKVECEPKS
ncbi:scavenger receptor cysteine-rich domain superfamily protein-like [Ruditapes philippinarum]|uniref:scavenger receptor cysteine-rich domain superfamily protein-like n=1 Tax=Ruditapes philippinarum TaxID=129788 RepID=UPI00295A657D|nr:scavenger receptor cysteine-rich domain superfamily protein-like [Ruditapes philippinarum]